MEFKLLALVIVVLCVVSSSEAFNSNTGIGKRSRLFKVTCSPFCLSNYYQSYHCFCCVTDSDLDQKNFDKEKLHEKKYFQNILVYVQLNQCKTFKPLPQPLTQPFTINSRYTEKQAFCFS